MTGRLAGFVFALAVAAVAGPAWAIVEGRDVQPQDFRSEAEKQRFRHLIKDLRCTVCQNQNLADSNAALARDLRRRILDQIQAGKSDQEIIDFLVARYGDFVLYRPPFKRSTWFLWLGPFLFFLVAAAILVAIIRRRGAATAALSAEERARLDAALRRAARDRSAS